MFPKFDANADYKILADLIVGGSQDEVCWFVDDYVTYEPGLGRRLGNLYLEEGLTLLSLACETASAQVVKSLLVLGSNADARDSGGTHLLTKVMISNSSVGDQRLDVLELLLQNGANPNSVAVGGGTLSVLGFAVYEGRYDAARLLIRYGGDVNIKCECGVKSAAEIAQKSGKLDFLTRID